MSVQKRVSDLKRQPLVEPIKPLAARKDSKLKRPYKLRVTYGLTTAGREWSYVRSYATEEAREQAIRAEKHQAWRSIRLEKFEE